MEPAYLFIINRSSFPVTYSFENVNFFLTDKQLPVAQIKNRAAALAQSYATDLESDFVDE